MNLFRQFHANSMAPSRALLFSTQALITPLKCKLQRTEHKASVVPILENWVKQDRAIKYSQLQEIIRELRSGRRFIDALQMLEWMMDGKGYELSAADIAVRLELTSRVHGIKQVEKYFDGIPYTLRGYEVCCELLSSYAHHDCLEKAEATMQTLREWGLLKSALPFNLMLKLYSKRGGKYHGEAFQPHTEEMREKGINKDRITYNILLEACSRSSSIDQMKHLLTELEADPLVKADWYHYLLAAEVYWNGGFLQEALTMLEKSEESMEGNLNEVYLSMILELSQKKDINGAEKIWEEWFSKKKEMDFRIPKAMISCYRLEPHDCKRAAALVLRMRKSGIEPDADTLDELADAYGECNQMDEAVETSMKAILVSKPGWKPEDLHTIVDCFKYLESKGNDVAKEELYKMLKEHCSLPKWLCDDLKDCKPIDSGNFYPRTCIPQG